MTLHPAVAEELLDAEIAAAELRLGDRITGISREGTDVYCRVEGTNVGSVTIRLDGREFDAEPFRVAVVDENGNIAAHDRWPGALSLGPHPFLGRPFACVQGTYEYHAHPTHLTDRWDLYRNQLRLPQLLDHLLRKAGR